MALFPDDLVAAVMIDLCHKELREHLELSTQEQTSEGVRREIANYVERKRDTINRNVKAMEVDNFEQSETWHSNGHDNETGWEEWTATEPYYDEINYMGKGSYKGKGKSR